MQSGTTDGQSGPLDSPIGHSKPYSSSPIKYLVIQQFTVINS